METNATKLRDIKSLVDIDDISIYIYWGIISIVVLIFVIGLYFAIQKIISLREVNCAKEYLSALDAIDWSSPKKAAYRATQYGRLLATDERRIELFAQLSPLLDRYKYRRDIRKIDDETKYQFELYKRVCHESV